MKKVLFQETQKFSQWWLWAILLICLAFSVNPIYEALNSGVGLSTDQWVGTIVIGIVMVLFFLFKLKTEITEDGIYVQFFPIHLKPKFYAWESIEHREVVTYSPLKDFGGWGIRFGRKGTAYNVKGNKGLQLILTNKDGLLIGTQKEEELKRVLHEIHSKIDVQ